MSTRNCAITALLAACFAAVSGLPVMAQTADPADPVKAAAALPTPRTSDGKVDLSGYWAPAPAPRPAANNPGVPTAQSPRLGASPPDSANEIRVFPDSATVQNVNAADIARTAQRRANTSLRPKYKPEFAAKAAAFFESGDLQDPTYGCMLPGVVRLGLPSEIFQRPGALVLLYEGLVNRFRVIPVDGRQLGTDLEPLPLGHAVGRYEGNALVIETRGFMPDYWLDKDGSFHTADLKLTERFTRTGNTLHYQLTAEDPMFAEPFRPAPQTLLLGKPDEHLLDEWACDERDMKNMVNSVKH